MKTILFISFLAVLAPGQTPNPAAVQTPLTTSIPFLGPAGLSWLSYAPNGQLLAETIIPLSITCPTCTIQRNPGTGKIQILAPAAASTNSFAFVKSVNWQVGWFPNTQPTDIWAGYTLWCFGLTAGNNATLNTSTLATFVSELRQFTPNATSGAAPPYTYSASGIVSVLPAPPAGTTSSAVPPIWVLNRAECNGGPGIVFAPNSLTTGETRTAVEAVISQ